MSLHYWFRNPAGTFEEITDRCRLYRLDVTHNAEEATIGTCELVVDDPEGDLIIGGHRRLYITEDSVASASNQIVWNGYTAEREVERGPYRTTNGRQWRVALIDHNTILERRILTAASANRPAETDVARMQWVEATAAGGLIDDTQYLSTAGGVAMDAVDYRGQKVADVINDCMQQSGKNAFLWLREEVTVDDGPGAISLWYGFSSSTNYYSDARLSNLLGDVDDVSTFAFDEEAELRRDPSRVYSGVYLQADGFDVYEQRSSTSTNFALGGRDTAAPAENVKTLAKATARAQRYLDDMSTEEDVITLTAYVPAASVNRFMPGMMTQVRGTHWPGYETFQSLRILNRNVVQLSEERYSIRMELTPPSGSSTAEVPTPGAEVVTALLEIGSAAYIGAGADRSAHYASQVGETLPTLEVGKEYRLVANVVTNFNSPLNGYDNMDGPGYSIVAGAASGTIVSDPFYNWTPGDGTTTSQGNYDGISFVYSPSHSTGAYGPGAVFSGDWLLYAGPPVVADIGIHGTGISGFYGFHWIVRLTLEKR